MVGIAYPKCGFNDPRSQTEGRAFSSAQKLTTARPTRCGCVLDASHGPAGSTGKLSRPQDITRFIVELFSELECQLVPESHAALPPAH
jgi:hypothetical protein